MRRWLPAIWAVLRRPSLWAIAVVQVVRLAAPGWWRRPPFLPLPDPDYLRFRMSTAYGDPTAAPTPGDVVAYPTGVGPGPGSSADAVAAVEALTAFRVHLPLVRPLRSAHGVERVRDVILVRLRTVDGVEGWGECPTLSDPGYSGETTELAWTALTSGGALGPMASGAIADARLDVRLRAEGRSLAEHLGATRTEVPTCQVVGVDGELPPSGAPAEVKVKVTPASVERLRGLDRKVSAIDGNGSFTSLDQVPSWLAELGLDYVEQPFPPGREEESRSMATRAGARLALDESIRSVADVERLARPGDVLNVKPARLGGIEAAVALADRAAGLGIGAFVGGMLETGIGRAGALALAARDGWAFPTDLGPSSRYFDEDVCDPIGGAPDGRTVLVPTGPGIGRTPDPDRLARCTIATAEVSLPPDLRP